MQNHPVWKRSRYVILLAAFLVAVVPAFSQSEGAPVSEAENGKIQGKADAHGSALWIIPGLLLPGVSLILPWVFSPKVPADNLIGKSDEFVAAYREAYIRQKKLGNFWWTLAGTGTTVVVVGVAVIVVAAQAAEGTATACGGSIGDACGNVMSEACSSMTPSCSSPSIGCSSLGFLPQAAFTALAPP
jgi:hypothetical protein